MKAKPYQISALKPQIQSQFQGALVFGTELGIVQEISEKIKKTVLKADNDDINLIKITPAKIKEIPSILLDEGSTTSFLGGRKLIWLKEGDDNQKEAVESYFNHVKTNTFLLISSGNLNKNSDLRVFCEAHPSVLTLACYPEDERVIGGYIQEYLGGYGIKVKTNVLSELVGRLSGNRLQAREELNKLINYLGDKKVVEAEDVFAIITDTQDVSKDMFCHSVALGNMRQVQKEYKILIENGENPVSIIRILYNYFNKLLDGNEIAAEQGIEMALKKMLRAGQFRLEDGMRQQLKIWKKEYIIKALDLLIKAEQSVKSTGIPTEVLLERIVLKIAQVAK